MRRSAGTGPWAYAAALGLVGLSLAARVFIDKTPLQMNAFLLTLAVVACAWLFATRVAVTSLIAGVAATIALFIVPGVALKHAEEAEKTRYLSPVDAAPIRAKYANDIMNDWVRPLYSVTLGVMVIGLFASVRRKSAEVSRESDARSLAEAETRDSRELLATALDVIADPMTVMVAERDLGGSIVDFRVRYLNQPGVETTAAKLARESFVGERLTAVYPHIGETGLFAEYVKVMETAEPFEREMRFKPDPTGQAGWYIVRVRKLDDGLVVQWQDVTERHEAAEATRLSEQRFRTFVEASSEVVWNCDNVGNILPGSRGWTDFTGQSVDEARGAGWYDAIHPEDRDRTADAWANAQRTKTPCILEHRVLRHDGQYRLMSVNGVPLIGEDGEIREWVGVHTDITDRRIAEDTIAESERHLRRVLNSLFAFVSVCTPDGTIIGANEAPLRAAGITFEAVSGKKLWETFWWSDLPEEQAAIRAAVERAAAGEPTRYDVNLRMADDVIMPVDFMIAPMYDADGKVTHLIPSGVDLTDRKRAETALAESELRYRGITEGLPSLVCSYAATGEAEFFSRRWNEYTGRQSETLVGYGWLDSVHPDDREQIARDWKNAVELGTVFTAQLRLRRHDGEYRWFDRQAVPIYGEDGKISRWFGSTSDVHERKLAEDAERTYSRQLALAADAARLGWFTWDVTQNRVSWSEATSRLLGHTWGRTAPSYEAWRSRIHPEDVSRVESDLMRAAGSRADFSSIYRTRPIEGETKWIEARGRYEFDPSGKPLNMEAVMIDITERMRADQALRDSEARFRRIYESNQIGIIFYNRDGKLTDVNDSFLKSIGYTREEYAGKGLNLAAITPIECHEQDVEAQSEIDQAGISKPYEKTFLHKSRSKVPVLVSAADLVPGNHDNGVAFIVDLSRLKRVEAALRRSQLRLQRTNESLEQRVAERTIEVEARSDQLRALALDLTETESRERKRLAQLLHDHFQQLVSAAKMKAGIVRRRLDEPGHVKSMQEMEKLLDEAITASRTLATELSPPVLHDAGLAAGLEWLSRKMLQDHHLNVDVAAEPETEPDNEQIRIILFECTRELLFNIVKHANTTEAWVELRRRQDGLLQVVVRDGGRGFDPLQHGSSKKIDGSFGLFSIKERLGLVGGLVKIVSRPGEGTRVELTVPVTSRSIHEYRHAGIDSAPIPSGGERRLSPSKVRVVVADDHRLFREGLVTLIMQEPYVEVVGQGADGAEAVELTRRLQPDILIVDVTMPKLNGVQVAAQVSRDVPGVKIIGLSMHERDDMAAAMKDAGAIAYCTKGGPSETLLSVLRNTAMSVTV